MLTLAAGTKKYLLIDDARIERNAERTKRGEPVVMVVEVTDDNVLVHRGFTVSINGDVQLEYQQNKPLKLARGMTEHAAWVTTGEVVLDADEAPQSATTPASPPKPAKTNTPKTPKE